MKGFDQNNPKWLCCCIHITTGIYIIASLEISGLIYSIIRTSLALAAKESGTESSQIYWSSRSLLPIELCMSLAGLLVVILLIVGVKRLIPAFLIVHIVGQLISAVTVIILIMVQTFYFGYREKLEDESEERTSIAIKLAIVVGITVAIAVVQIYVIYLLLRCIAFIKAKAEAERVSSNMWKSVETNRRQSAAPAGTNGLRRESRSATEVLSVVRLETPRRESGNPRRNSNRP